MPSRIGGPLPVPASVPSTAPSATDPRGAPPTTPTVRPDAFDRAPTAGNGTAGNVGTSGSGGDFRALIEAVQPRVHAAEGYEAHFIPGGRAAKAVFNGSGEAVALPTGAGRGPSFTAEAGKPLTVSVDASRVTSSAEKVELVWRMAPSGEEHVLPLTDGTRDASGKLVMTPARIDVPEDATGVMRLTIRQTSADGRVSNNWDPSNDAAIASRDGAAIVFDEAWGHQLAGTLRAGDSLKLAYDADRMSQLFGGGAPRELTACVSFDGEPPLEFPLQANGKQFMPTLRVPFEATRVSIWFKGQDGGRAEWDSAGGRNFTFDVGVARDDADPSWKNEMLRSTSFPNLKADRFVGIGPSSQRYNCIAWTVGMRDQWVWPGTRVEDFDRLYGEHGYRPLEGLDLSHDPNVEKIVIYGLEPRSGTGPIEVTHGAKMDASGRFISKLGTQPLIRHESADDLAGPSYGKPIRVYVRPRAEVPA